MATLDDAVLLHLKAVGKRDLRDALIDGWSACAPPAPARQRARRARAR